MVSFVFLISENSEKLPFPPTLTLNSNVLEDAFVFLSLSEAD